MHGNRCVLYFYFQDLDAEAALQMMADGLDSEEDLMTEVGRHSVAMLKKLSDDEPFEEMEEYARAIENTFLTETGKDVFVGVSEPHEDLINMPEAFEEARNAINVGRIYHSNRSIFVYRNLLLERFLSEVSPEMSANYNGKTLQPQDRAGCSTRKWCTPSRRSLTTASTSPRRRASCTSTATRWSTASKRCSAPSGWICAISTTR